MLVRLRLLPSLSFLAPLMHRASRVLAWGEHRGGMFVAVEGRDPTAAQSRAPGISSPKATTARSSRRWPRRRSSAAASPAARPRPARVRPQAISSYPTTMRLFARRQIVTGRRQDLPSSQQTPLYRRLLGDAWEELPEPVRTMHDLDTELTAEGRASVERGKGPAGADPGRAHRLPAGRTRRSGVGDVSAAPGPRILAAHLCGPFASRAPRRRAAAASSGFWCERFGPLAFGDGTGARRRPPAARGSPLDRPRGSDAAGIGAGRGGLRMRRGRALPFPRRARTSAGRA